ncbi:chorion class CB protein M5H4-like [Danaus plexippus]|uniref:chorion class CB protein M5H4-like n=1 Tax=Danaus plexippus TaxID=13037 RepID=UPI002AB2B6E6|nr:chorion class CB protein M5H4-like [Danaus plexippus]
MSTKTVVFVCLQSLFIQGLLAQCIGAYNGLAAGGWPASNAVAWENGMNWPGSALSWEAGVPYGAGSCAASSLGASYSAASLAAAPLAAEWGAGYSPAGLAASNGGGLAINSYSPIAPTGVSMNSENMYEGPLAVSGAVPFLGAVALEGNLPTGGAGAVAYGCGNGNVAMLSEDYAGASFGAGLAGPAYGYNGLGGSLALEAGNLGPAYGYNGLAGPLALEAGNLGPAYGYNNYNGARIGGCGCGALY